MSGRRYKQKDLETLFGLAAARCSFPQCRTEVVWPLESPDDPVIVGQIGHIVAHSDHGPRANPSLPEKERDLYSNLILLCPSHHKLVDTLDSKYSVAELQAYKAMHEKWVIATLSENMDKFGTPEIEVVCAAVQSDSNFPSTSFNTVPPHEKMEHNGLGNATNRLLTIGFMRSDAVAQYLERTTAYLDPNFPERLRAGFVIEYDKFWQKGLRGDALFLAMTHFAAAGKTQEFERYAAGLAVLSHLFQVCDVFERPEDVAS